MCSIVYNNILLSREGVCAKCDYYEMMMIDSTTATMMLDAASVMNQRIASKHMMLTHKTVL